MSLLSFAILHCSNLKGDITGLCPEIKNSVNRNKDSHNILVGIESFKDNRGLGQDETRFNNGDSCAEQLRNYIQSTNLFTHAINITQITNRENVVISGTIEELGWKENSFGCLLTAISTIGISTIVWHQWPIIAKCKLSYEVYEINNTKKKVLSNTVSSISQEKVDLWSPTNVPRIEILKKLYCNVLSGCFEQIIKDIETQNETWTNLALEKPFRIHPAAVQQVSPTLLTAVESKDLSDLNYCQAIIVGLSQYKYTSKEGLGDLAYASEDARNFYDTLIKLGWTAKNIKLLLNEDAVKENIESWIRYGQDLSNSQIVIFWAGHGYTDPVDPQKFFFACYDTNIQKPGSGLRMNDVKSWLTERNARNVIFIADACHAGGIITGRDSGSRDLSIKIRNSMSQRDVPKGWIYLLGAKEQSQSFEHPDLKSGLFTHCLLKALDGEADGYGKTGIKDGMVTMGEVHEFINDKIKELANQFHLQGDFEILGNVDTSDKSIWQISLQKK